MAPAPFSFRDGSGIQVRGPVSGGGGEGRSWGKGPVRGDRGGGKLGTRRLGAPRDERIWSNGAGGRRSRTTTDGSGRILGEGSE